MPEKTQPIIRETNLNDNPPPLEVKTQENGIINKTHTKVNTQEKKWKRIANWSLIILALLFIIFAVLAYIPGDRVITYLQALPGKIDEQFFWMLAIGFAAQMVDGALGMGYGVISTTLLLSGGVNPVVVSGRMHTEEMFSSGASGYSHYKLGNVNKKLFKTLLN